MLHHMSSVPTKDVLETNIRMRMHRQGVSQKELARRLGCSVTTVNQWLNPEKPNLPNADQYDRIAQALGLDSLADLLSLERVLSGQAA